MNIVHLLSSEHLGGAETMCLQLCRGLQERGHSVSVFSFAEGDVAKRAKEWGVSFTAAELPRTTESRGKRWHRMALHLAEYLRVKQPDIVHSHLPITNVLCHSLRRQLACPWVCTIHGSWKIFGYAPATVDKPWLMPVLAARHAIGDWWTTRSAARIIANSNYVASELSRIGISDKRINVVYNGLEPRASQADIRTTARARLGVAENELLISSIGFLAPVKGFDILIRAFERVAAEIPSSKCFIVGRGVLGDETVSKNLSAQIAAAGLQARCQIDTQRKELDSILAASDVFCVSSRSEGFSLVLLQAMQFGLPSVVTSAGGCKEVARPEMESLVYRSPSSSDLSEKLIHMLSDNALRTKLASGVRSRAEEFGRDRCVSGYVSVYDAILKQGRATR